MQLLVHNSLLLLHQLKVRECVAYTLLTMKQFEIEDINPTDTDNEDVNNYAMLKREDSVLALLGGLSMDNPRSSSLTPLDALFIQQITLTKVSFQLSADAKPQDLVCLLQKWCLEGPYSTDQSARFCFVRGRHITISNTIYTNEETWGQLASIMKYCLKRTEDCASLVQVSPMMRYYGDLYPDNGRDENMDYGSMNGSVGNMGIDTGIC